MFLQSPFAQMKSILCQDLCRRDLWARFSGLTTEVHHAESGSSFRKCGRAKGLCAPHSSVTSEVLFLKAPL